MPADNPFPWLKLPEAVVHHKTATEHRGAIERLANRYKTQIESQGGQATIEDGKIWAREYAARYDDRQS